MVEPGDALDKRLKSGQGCDRERWEESVWMARRRFNAEVTFDDDNLYVHS
jgi:hypothetical protein